MSFLLSRLPSYPFPRQTITPNKKTTKKGEGKVGHIMVNHPTKDKGQWDTIDLTAKGKAKTVKQGVAATKKWHKDNPDYKYKGKGNGRK